MSLRLESVLNDVSVVAIAEDRGFQEKNNVEKFLMDFEVQSHIAESLDCTVRGGMCMPFYTDGKENRTSVDIDLLTRETVTEAEEAIAGTNLPSGIVLERHNPINPHPLDNLLTYKARFGSCFGGRKHIKIDIFADVKVELGTTIIRSGSPVIGFDVPRDMRVLSRGWLLGDKMTSLALNIVGVKRIAETAKQAYDMGVLIRGATKSDIVGTFDAFSTLTTLKATKFDKGKYEITDIAADIESSVPKLISLEHAITLTRDQEKHYNGFNSTYVSKASYRKTRHVTNILMVCVLAKAVRECVEGKIERGEAAARVHDVVTTALRVEGEPKGSWGSRAGHSTKVLKNALPEHAVLAEAAGLF